VSADFIETSLLKLFQVGISKMGILAIFCGVLVQSQKKFCDTLFIPVKIKLFCL
jgi:hypothetical protein